MRLYASQVADTKLQKEENSLNIIIFHHYANIMELKAFSLDGARLWDENKLLKKKIFFLFLFFFGVRKELGKKSTYFLSVSLVHLTLSLSLSFASSFYLFSFFFCVFGYNKIVWNKRSHKYMMIIIVPCYSYMLLPFLLN